MRGLQVNGWKEKRVEESLVVVHVWVQNLPYFLKAIQYIEMKRT